MYTIEATLRGANLSCWVETTKYRRGTLKLYTVALIQQTKIVDLFLLVGRLDTSVHRLHLFLIWDVLQHPAEDQRALCKQSTSHSIPRLNMTDVAGRYCAIWKLSYLILVLNCNAMQWLTPWALAEGGPAPGGLRVWQMSTSYSYLHWKTVTT